jgi:hypothetical protein
MHNYYSLSTHIYYMFLTTYESGRNFPPTFPEEYVQGYIMVNLNVSRDYISLYCSTKAHRGFNIAKITDERTTALISWRPKPYAP